MTHKTAHQKDYSRIIVIPKLPLESFEPSRTYQLNQCKMQAKMQAGVILLLSKNDVCHIRRTMCVWIPSPFSIHKSHSWFDFPVLFYKAHVQALALSLSYPGSLDLCLPADAG